MTHKHLIVALWMLTTGCPMGPARDDGGGGGGGATGGGGGSMGGGTGGGGATVSPCTTWTSSELLPIGNTYAGGPYAAVGAAGEAFFAMPVPSTSGSTISVAQLSGGAWTTGASVDGPIAELQVVSNAAGDALVFWETPTGWTTRRRPAGGDFGAPLATAEPGHLELFRSQPGAFGRTPVTLDSAGNAAVFYRALGTGAMDVKVRQERGGAWQAPVTLLSSPRPIDPYAGVACALRVDGGVSLGVFPPPPDGGRLGAELTYVRTTAAGVTSDSVVLPEAVLLGTGNFNLAGEGLFMIWSTTNDGGVVFSANAVPAHADGTLGAPQPLATFTPAGQLLAQPVVGDDGSAWVWIPGRDLRLFYRNGPSGDLVEQPIPSPAGAVGLFAVAPNGVGYLLELGSTATVVTPYSPSGFGTPTTMPTRGPLHSPALAVNAQGTLAVAYLVPSPDGGQLPITSVCY